MQCICILLHCGGHLDNTLYCVLSWTTHCICISNELNYTLYLYCVAMRGHPPLGMFPGGELASLAIQQRERGRTAIGATEDNARLYNGTFAFVQYWRRNTDTILTTSELHIFRVMSGSVTMLLGSSTFGFPPKLPGTQIWRNWISLQGKWTVREVNAVLYLKQTTSWGTQEEVDLLDTSTHRSSEEHPLVSPVVLPGIQTMAANGPPPWAPMSPRWAPCLLH